MVGIWVHESKYQAFVKNTSLVGKEMLVNTKKSLLNNNKKKEEKA